MFKPADESLQCAIDMKSTIAKSTKLKGRSEDSLKSAITHVMKKKSGSSVGTVGYLQISPASGIRLAAQSLLVKHSVVGDCQSATGTIGTIPARIKNVGAELLPPVHDNVLIEAILCAVTVTDEEIMNEIIPQDGEISCSGDNLYVSGLDLSWDNLAPGDFLVLPEVAVLVTAFPHWACSKYADKVGPLPRRYINSPHGASLRCRGLKGPVLIATQGRGQIHNGDPVRIVHHGTEDYKVMLLSYHVPPFPANQAELVFSDGSGQDIRASVADTEAYIKLLLRAGVEAAKRDTRKYNRDLPAVIQRSLGISSPKRRRKGSKKHWTTNLEYLVIVLLALAIVALIVKKKSATW